MRFPIRTASLLLAATALLPIAYAQSLQGRWAVPEKTLDNGDTPISIVELTQQGDVLKGELHKRGWSMPLTGKVTGNHFELIDDRQRVFAKGDLVNGTLQAQMGQKATPATLRRATATEGAMPAYIAPPSSLHAVPPIAASVTPPMGWNSWNLFADKVDDATVRTMADAMVSSGMRDAGYVYINIDDTWQGVRDAKGVLQPNHKFPDMKALADYVHSKGLKLGIYSSPGPYTCASYPGSYGHEEIDAKTYAAWGIDYLKYDWCSAGSVYKDADIHAVYQRMGDALHATGRPILYSLCEYGKADVSSWGASVGASVWRTTGDIRDSWASMLENVLKQEPTAKNAGPGKWNDPDMLEVGNGHMTNEEYRTHMSLWAMVASPLLAGNDLRSMTDETKAILMNREVIAIDQDRMGRQATVTHGANGVDRWVKPMSDGAVAVALVNTGASATNGTVRVQDVAAGTKHARDLWAHKDVSLSDGAYSATIPSHGTLLLVLKP